MLFDKKENYLIAYMVDNLNLPTMGTTEAQKYLNIILTISFCIIFFISIKIIRKISPKMNALIIYFGPFISTRFREKFWRHGKDNKNSEKSKENQNENEKSSYNNDEAENQDNKSKVENECNFPFTDNPEKFQNLQDISLNCDIDKAKFDHLSQSIIEWNQEDCVFHKQNPLEKFKAEVDNPNFDFEKIRKIYRELNPKDRGTEEALALYINALQRHCKNIILVEDDNLFLELADYCEQVKSPVSLQLFNIIICLLTSRKLYNRAWKIYENFNNMNFNVTQETDLPIQIEKYSILIQNFILEEFNKADEIKQEILKTMGGSPDGSRYAELLVQIDQKFINLCKRVKNNDLNSKINDNLTQESYNNLIIYNSKKQNFAKAFKSFKEMLELRIHPSEFSISVLIECAIKTDNFSSIKHLHQMISDQRIEISSVIGTNLIQAYSYTQDFWSARSVFEMIFNAGLVFDNIIPMNAMLDCSIVCNNFDYFFYLYKLLFPLELSKFTPDLVTYSTIIKGLCKSDLLEEALKIFDIVKMQNIKLDEQIFTCLLQGFAKSRIPHKAFHIVEEMERMNIQKSKYTISILIKIYGLLNRTDLALKCFESIKATEEDLGKISYTCIIKALCKNKEASKAISIFQEMISKNIPIDKVLYNTIIKGCVLSGKINYACAILKRSIDKNIVLAVDIYNTVLQSLVASKEVVKEAKSEYISQFFNFIKIRAIPVDCNIMAYLTNILFGNISNYGFQGVYYAANYY